MNEIIDINKIIPNTPSLASGLGEIITALSVEDIISEPKETVASLTTKNRHNKNVTCSKIKITSNICFISAF